MLHKREMRMKLVAIPLAPLLAFLLSGCTGMTVHEGGNTLVGAFTAAGLDSVAARAMDKIDRSLAARALETVPSGQSANWRNRETGDSFVLTPTRTFDQLGATCREFTVRVEVGGHADTASGRACRKDDGSWHMSG
jgi:surface antigen